MNKTVCQQPSGYHLERPDLTRLAFYAVQRVHPVLRVIFGIVWFLAWIPACLILFVLVRGFAWYGTAVFMQESAEFYLVCAVMALIAPFLVLIVQLSLAAFLSMISVRSPGRRAVRADAQGVTLITQSSTIALAWPSIRAVKLDRGATYFFADTLNAIVSPRRAHSHKQAARQFYESAVLQWNEGRNRHDDAHEERRRIIYLPELKDQWEFTRKIRRAKTISKPLAHGMIAFQIVVVLIYIGQYFSVAAGNEPWVPGSVFVVSFLVPFGVLFTVGSGLWHMYRLRYHAGAMDPASVEIDRQGVRYTTADGPHWIPWHDVSAIATSRSLIVLEARDFDAIVIPKRAFATAGAATAFLDAVRAFRDGTTPGEAEGVWPPAPRTA